MPSPLRPARALVALLSLLLAGPTLAQTPAAGALELRLVNGTYRLPAGTFRAATAPEVVAGRYYRLVQFDKLPTDAERAALTQRGEVELLAYLPQNAWLAAFRVGPDPARALRGLAVHAVVPVDPAWKLSDGLTRADYPSHAVQAGNRVALRVQHYAPVPRAEAVARLRALGAAVTETDETPDVLDVVVGLGQERRLAAEPWVQYVEAAAPPPALEGERDVTNHRANVLNSNLPAGRRLDGTGVVVSIGDDGLIGPHIDFQGRLTNLTAVSNGDHADHVVGIIGGGGNLNPTVYGQAPGATLRVYANYNDISTMTGASGLYTANAVRISSHSLGQTCNGGYTSDARTSDQHIRLNPALMYVHSAGNSGTSNCSYKGVTLAGWGNITGGFKMGKNVLAVGNLSHLDALSSSSSRGPASDGRIKPDICAVGSSVNSTGEANTYNVKSGTSMACPAVSGVLAQLYQAYRNANAGADPNSALLKAAVLATADDLGNAGPDFKYGFGRINALRAVEVLENTRYVTNTVTSGQTRTVSISVPSGVSQVKVMLYWADYEAAANAATALVNDLDLTLTTPGGAPVTYQPWVLNPAANATTLDAPATRGIDRLNNVEQVTLDAPVAGTYTATITGHAVPQGPQRYYVVYSWQEDNVRLTFPIGGEAFVPGESQTLRWDANTTATGFTLEYSTNGGGSWASIGTATAGARSRSWTVPAAAVSGQMRVRVTRGGQSSQSANFSSILVPASLRTEWVCATETRLAWNAVAGATSYEVFQLGSQKMQVLGATTALAYTVTGVAAGTEYWFSVRALGPNALVGRRANALRRQTGQTGCPSQPPTAAIAPLPADPCPTTTVPLTDASTENPTAWLWSAAPGPMTFVDGTSAASQNPKVQFATTGPQTLSLRATNAFGNTTTTRALSVSEGRVVTLAQPFSQPDFSGTFPPAGWRVNSSGGAYTWQQSAAIPGPTGASGQFALFNNYSYNNPGAQDALVLPRLNLTGLNAPQLRFFVAYAPYNATSLDGLRVDVAANCTGAFGPSDFLKEGLALGTAGGYQTSSTWAPTGAAQWREEVVDLAALLVEAGEGGEVQLVNLNDYGQRLYLGGIVVEGQAPLPLTLLDFRAQRRAAAAADLTWQTAQEVNTEAFGIERSVDGHQWRVLGQVAAAGTTTTPRSYRWRDEAAPNTDVFYRLRLTDRDGTFRYTPAYTLRGSSGEGLAPLLVWPVPLTTDALNVRAATPLHAAELTDGVGRVVRRADLATPTTDLTLDVRGLPAGLYVLRTRPTAGAEQRVSVVRE